MWVQTCSVLRAASTSPLLSPSLSLSLALAPRRGRYRIRAGARGRDRGPPSPSPGTATWRRPRRESRAVSRARAGGMSGAPSLPLPLSLAASRKGPSLAPGAPVEANEANQSSGSLDACNSRLGLLGSGATIANWEAWGETSTRSVSLQCKDPAWLAGLWSSSYGIPNPSL